MAMDVEWKALDEGVEPGSVNVCGEQLASFRYAVWEDVWQPNRKFFACYGLARISPLALDFDNPG